MIKLIIKVSIFLIPLIILNFVFYHLGYLDNEKKYFILKQLISSKDSSSKNYNVLCFGTSRLNTGLSPSYLAKGMNNYIDKKINCINLSFSAQQPGYLIQEKTKQITYSIDLTIIELYPTENPNRVSINLPKTPYESLNEYLEYYFTKYSTINLMDQILKNNIRNNLAIKYTYTHEDGWEERTYNKNKNNNEIDRLKIEWYNRAIKELNGIQLDNITYNYHKFIKTIRDYQEKTNTILCFVRMPVDGKLETIQDSILIKTKMIDRILGAFPMAIYVDAKNEKTLKEFNTIEESHLSSEDAKLFSYQLGILLGKKINQKKKSNY